MTENDQTPTEGATVRRMARIVGGTMSPERRSEIYFGKPPKDAYFGFNRDPANIHDLRMSDDQKKRLYGLGGDNVRDVGDVVDDRLETDSKAGLIRELVEQTALTRTEAEALVARWMSVNDLVEVPDRTLGKIIVPRDRR